MSECLFKKVIVIGYGKITGEVLSYVKSLEKKYGYELEFIEYEVHAVSITHKICTDEGIPYNLLPEKDRVTEKFLSVTEPLLIISASNNYLFPAAVVDRENTTVINFHNALLPKFPGRNAPSWAMFEGESETGITWHYVTPGVDDGAIIVQKKAEITADMKAYALAGTLMKIAYEGFVECFEKVLTGTAEVTHQTFPPNRKMYFSKMVPAEGVFSLEDDPVYIYRLLRSTDYGPNDIFPKMRTKLEGKDIEIVRYSKVDAAKADANDGAIYLPLDEGSMLRLKYKEL
ncbi:MAG TPA: formyltransferase family protein [Methanocorpusculum sp.]|nr:formyltransferase family protein [Methanocorpusculum sp.]